MPRLAADIPAALSLLTRLPMRHADFGRGAAAAWAWPVAGLVLGGLGAVAIAIAAASGLPAAASAGIGLAVVTFLSGAMHEDGLADTADGLWGGWTRERRLEIMRDSRIGSYGVLALVFVTGLRWVALTALVTAGVGGPALIAAATLSRATMAPIARLPQARTDGLSAGTGRPTPSACLAGLVLALCTAILLFGPPGLVPALAAVTAAMALGFLAHVKIGGQTGDILGATQQMAEVAAFLALAAMLG
ncbi:cobalamin-5'-phosphate synthase [Palleronia aestuarii]|uniref:Adenosylcobinamide-GDP ribazoletransferase n=1 Tax=Palleronia aestuarii TaxID=568105 RepID=A0A2W7N7D1_9RHOB|nr:adenosylcobinamide-GDP ribazoletransferase [Palleronia aestuarii]PZX16031.1 cobalamin-5'-phosphate synthase [Palleronia aestuarii]